MQQYAGVEKFPLSWIFGIACSKWKLWPATVCFDKISLFLGSDIHLRNNISCPVSPTRSPLLRSRSPHNGYMTPSPISSPRTTSGASTPLTGGTGAVPFNNLSHQSSYYANDGYVPSIRVQQCSPAAFRERIISESDILSPHFGKMVHGNVRDPYDSQSVADTGSRRIKLNPSLDLRPGNTTRGYWGNSDKLWS